MAVIAQTQGVLGSSAPVALTRTTLSSSDTLTYFPGSGQFITFLNTTAGVLNVTLVGTAPRTLAPDGYGGTVSTAGGKVVSVAANGSTYVRLDSISAFLDGTGQVTLTGGSGLFAVLCA